MKRVISLITVVTILCTLFVATPTSAASSAVGSSELLFYADFDEVNPDAVKLDANATFEISDYGKALKITTAADENGKNVKTGAYFAVDSFTHGNAMIKFDIKHNAGYHFHGSLWDSTGAQRTFRIQKTELTTNAWYTYLIDPYTLVDGKYVGYRKLKDGTTWEAATIIRYGDPGTTDAYTNTLKLGSGSASSNSNGIWYVDNVAVYSNLPAANVIVPENPDKAKVNYVVNDNLNGDSCVWTSATGLAFADIVTDSEDATNKIFEVDGGMATSADKRGALSSITSAKHVLPTREQGYTISFDFRKLEDGKSNDQIWLKTGKSATATTVAEDTTSKIFLSQFETGVWYNVSITITGDSATVKSNATKTNLATGETTKLTASISTSGWTSAKDNFTITSYNNTQRSTADSWEYSEADPVSPWDGFHWQMDNMKLSYDTANPITAEIITKTAAGAIKPLIVAYDSLGIATAVIEGDAKTLEAIAEFGAYGKVNFDIMPKVDAFLNASSVKVLAWDGYDNAKAYVDAVDVSATIAGNAASTLTARELEITADMIPSGATGNYTVMAYAIPFTASKESIPAYNASAHKLLAIQQSETAPSKFVFDSNLYNGVEQDIVIICNADGAEAPVVTLYEENEAPQFKNVAMLLGKDITERNFTWYSLSNEAGKITYQKKSELIDGEFTDNAAVAEATRYHADDVYSSKEFYYHNEAVMTGLEPGETYVYQLSNGAAKSAKYTIVIGEKKTSFSFLFSGDPQVGGNDNANYEQEHTYWGRSVKQMVSAPEFEGVEFYLSAGDQVESGSTVEIIEDQYDIYLEHEEFKTFPMSVTTGNHDAKSAGLHIQHFNEPNMLINPETGKYYGESGGTAIDGADYYYVYNSVLFMHLNLNTFDDLSNGDEASRLDDKADAEEHAAFINAVLEETKDNKDILWKVVYCHQSPFGGSYHGNYTKNSKGAYNRTEQYDYINIREYLVPYLYEAGIDLVLSGHDHTYTRSHVIKPNENDDILGDELNSMVISPYANTSGENYYTYADGTTTPKFTSWTDKSGNVFDGSSDNRPYLKVSSVPVKVTDPDGFIWVTGGSGSGSQVNGAEYPNHYAAVCQSIAQRAMSRIDVTPTSLKLVTYNIGTNEVNNDPLQVVDEFEIVRTANVAVGGVSLEKTAEIPVGQTKTLKAVLSPVEPTNRNVTWSSDNEAVATVENGVVTAKSIGTANITVTTEDGGFTATCAVTVVQGVPVTAITLPETFTMSALTTRTIVATVAPDNASTKTLSWTSDNADIATVDQGGNITAYKNGEVTITATATDGSGVTASCVVTITHTPMTSLALDKITLDLDVMDIATLTASFAPANATFKELTWSSSDPEIVSVDQKGNIEAMKVGTAVITVTSVDGLTASCTVTSNGGVNFFEDFEDEQLNVTVSDKTVWTSVTEADGNKVYNFDGSKLTAFSNLVAYLESGMYNAPIADSGCTISFDYKKTAAGGYPALEFKTYSHDGVFGGTRFVVSDFEVGEWYNVKLVYTKESGWVKYYKKASDTEYSVQNGNLAYAPSNHTGNIYYDRFYFSPWIAKASNDMNNGSDSSAAARLANAQKTAFVIDDIKISTDVAATGMTIAESSANLEVGETAAITPVFAPANATDINVTYKSSNEAVATVNRFGKVTAVGAGTADITVTAADGGFVQTYSVTVNAIVPEITVVKDGTKFTVTTNVAVDGKKVYVAAYNASNVMIASTVADYVADGTELTLAADGASYYKAFIWGENAAPVVSEKKFN